jgi:hypothetical protein
MLLHPLFCLYFIFLVAYISENYIAFKLDSFLSTRPTLLFCIYEIWRTDSCADGKIFLFRNMTLCRMVNRQQHLGYRTVSILSIVQQQDWYLFISLRGVPPQKMKLPVCSTVVSSHIIWCVKLIFPCYGSVHIMYGMFCCRLRICK